MKMSKENLEDFTKKFGRLVDVELSEHEERKAEMDKFRKEGTTYFQPRVKIELHLTPSELIVISKILLELNKNDEA